MSFDRCLQNYSEYEMINRYHRKTRLEYLINRVKNDLKELDQIPYEYQKQIKLRIFKYLH